MTTRPIDVFFYGLFMDQAALKAQGLTPSDPRIASVTGFKLHIGNRATLVLAQGGEVWGIVMGLPILQAETLYAEASVADYKPEPVLARLADDEAAAALCYNLIDPGAGSTNKDYAAALHALAGRLGLPANYVNFLSELAN